VKGRSCAAAARGGESFLLPLFGLIVFAISVIKMHETSIRVGATKTEKLIPKIDFIDDYEFITMLFCINSP
jgi:hypothetical protein